MEFEEAEIAQHEKYYKKSREELDFVLNE